MTDRSLCAQCGARMSPNTLSGLCPRCVGAMGFALWDEDEEAASSLLSPVDRENSDRMSFSENGGKSKAWPARAASRIPELGICWAIGLSFVLGFLSWLLWRAMF